MAQHVAQLELFEHGQCLAVEFVEFLFLDQSLLDEVEARGHLIDSQLHFLAAVDPVAQRLDFFHLCLGGLLVLPKVGHVGSQFFFLDLDFLAVDVQIAFEVFLALL